MVSLIFVFNCVVCYDALFRVPILMYLVRRALSLVRQQISGLQITWASEKCVSFPTAHVAGPLIHTQVMVLGKYRPLENLSTAQSGFFSRCAVPGGRVCHRGTRAAFPYPRPGLHSQRVWFGTPG